MDAINYDDIKEYEKLFTLTPAFLLERFAKKDSNLVSKFGSKVESYLQNLNDNQKNKLDIVLNSDVEELQALMSDAYEKSGVKQYKILANPDYRQFIEKNLDEIRKLVSI